MRDRNWFPAFFIGMAATAAIALLVPKEPVDDEFWEKKVIAAPAQEELGTITVTDPQAGDVVVCDPSLTNCVNEPPPKWRFSEAETVRFPGDPADTQVIFFQDTKAGTCYVRFNRDISQRWGITRVPCEATDR